ncbi:unnamed protein product [Calicophoron daubneyi]|uniref:Testicular haploid expressed protein n=1 Tax=Calicophoron daubneyi TaxID=300641 RepID=A0AAV2TJV5_CALDB
MSLASTSSIPANLCRCLFGKPKPAVVQQELKAIILKEQEKFNKIWNFPLLMTQKEETRKPLCQRNPVANHIIKAADFEELSGSGWQLFTPEAMFYRTPPRRLKAYRRLRQTVAQKTKFELMNIQTEAKPLTTTAMDCVNPSQESALIKSVEQGAAVPNVGSCEDALSASKTVLSTTPAMPQRAVVPATPIIIRPSEEDFPRLPYLEALRISDCEDQITKPPSVVRSKLILVKPSRHSEKIVKRKSIAKVTDYFTISKRARQSLK